jgi:alanine racemase
MQSALLTVHEGDKTGDEVTLLDKELTPEEVANEWGVTPHEALLTLVSMGERCYSS